MYVIVAIPFSTVAYIMFPDGSFNVFLFILNITCPVFTVLLSCVTFTDNFIVSFDLNVVWDVYVSVTFSLSNVIVPSTFNIGSVTISLYTNSKSPLMAKQLRKKIQSIITETDILFIELQEYVRYLLKKHVSSQDDRKEFMIHVNEDEIVQKLIEEGKLDEAKKYVKCLIEKIN